MDFRPEGWSVVLIGRWNPAIFTPAGIKQHVFRLEPSAKIQVAVPLDGISAYLVSDPNDVLVVHAGADKVQIDVKSCKFNDLLAGMEAGKNTLDALPVTPISAVGFNLNYKSNNFETEIASLLENPIDRKFRLAGKNIIHNSATWSFSCKDGKINFTVVVNENETRLNFNFHLGTADVKKAADWLSMTEETIKTELNQMSTILNVPFGEKS